MDATRETVGRVLRSWLATEVLTPQVTRNGWGGLAADKQGQQRNTASTIIDNPGLWEQPDDDDPPPWPLREGSAAANDDQDVVVEGAVVEGSARERPSRSRPWYSVVLGALPAKQAFARLDLAYFPHTADAVLGVAPAAAHEGNAWGLMAARLGRARNRRAFFQRFWWDPEWGLNDWPNLVAWPDAPQNRSKKLGRLARTMFSLANRIAYDERMVFATQEGASPIRDLLGSSAWIDVDAPATDKWVEAEGRLIAAVLARLCDAMPAPPDRYVICPFRMPAAQGKEAEAVILMLGAGRGAKAGSRSWAGATPNLLDVAATRAKRALRVVGSRTEWRAAGAFAVAAEVLHARSGHEWLRPGRMEAAQ